MQPNIYPKSRAEAKVINSVHYCTGRPCINGHVDLRFTSTCACRSCLRLKVRVSHHTGKLSQKVCPKCGCKYNRRSCPDCRKANHRRYYLENLLFIRRYKITNPCIDCGHHYSWVVMEFDHREKRSSRMELIAYKVHRRRNILLAEMQKCDLVCANCHRVRTYERGLLEGKYQLVEDPDSPGKKMGTPIMSTDHP